MRLNRRKNRDSERRRKRAAERSSETKPDDAPEGREERRRSLAGAVRSVRSSEQGSKRRLALFARGKRSDRARRSDWYCSNQGPREPHPAVLLFLAMHVPPSHRRPTPFPFQCRAKCE